MVKISIQLASMQSKIESLWSLRLCITTTGEEIGLSLILYNMFLQLLILTGATALNYCQWTPGIYYPEQNIIAVCAGQGWGENSVLKHEYGHYLWFKCLDDKARDKYHKLYARDQKSKKRFFREYGQISFEEWFADDYLWSHYKKELGHKTIFLSQRSRLVEVITKDCKF